MNVATMTVTTELDSVASPADMVTAVSAAGAADQSGDASSPREEPAAGGVAYTFPPLAAIQGDAKDGQPHSTPVAAAPPTAPAAPGRVSSWAVGTMMFLGATAVASAILAFSAARNESAAQTKAHAALEEREHALKNEAEAKAQRDQAQAALAIITKERNQARKEAATARRAEQTSRIVLAFLEDTVLSAGRQKKAWGDEPDKQVSLRKALDLAEARLAQAAFDQPLAQAFVREILGSGYLNLGEAARAVKHFERALALRRGLAGDTHPDTITCRDRLAVAYRLAGCVDDAARLFNQRGNARK